ncbi:CREB-binding protein [Fasciolopsis buskii]|uniref:histone acetyltransferase n=1 Tax=Fasciolopsis buskii TaxID=27845 RepID=A0A8E0S4L5_9TREM|nr:CREB-binding protein [Fasciolopsis buski]
MDEEDAKRKREQEALAKDDDDDDTKENLQTRENDKNPGKKKAKKRKLKRNSLSLPGKRKRLAGSGSTDEVARRVYEIMEKHKENFFVIRLHPQNAVSSLPPIKDPDPLVNSDLMECRGAFLEQAREKHLEFSTIRRAKYSTLVMLYELHNENRQPLMYTCNVCSAQLETPWHCKHCIEYDLCPRCYEREKHPHPMVQIGLGLNDGAKGQDVDNESATVQESGRDKLSRLVKALGHGCSCRDANCRVYACKTMKFNVQHFRVHAASSCNQCSICQSLSILCYYHSKTCHEVKCPVPLCPKLKAKMKQQQKQQRLKQTQMLRRRMATMQRCNSLTPSHQPTPPPPQPYQQFSQPPSNTEFASSPAANSMQLSPFPSSAVTSTASFTMASPLSRPSTSLNSPQQSFVHPTGPGGSLPNPMTQQHSKFPPNSSVPSSPSITSPLPSGSNAHNFEPSPSPFMPVSQPGIVTDTDPLTSNQQESCLPVNQSYHSQPRSQPPASNIPVLSNSNQQAIRPVHQLERSLSGQFNSSVGAAGTVHSAHPQHSHPQLARQSPSTQPIGNAPASPRYQQFYPTQSSTLPVCPEPAASMQFSTAGMPSGSLSRTPSEGHTMSYMYAKPALQSQTSHTTAQRHLSQPPCQMSGDAHSMMSSQNHFQNNFSTGNPSWRVTTPEITGPVMYSAGASIMGPNESGGVCTQMQPNVTVARSVPSTNLHNCPTPPLNSNTVSPEDVRVVQQTYNAIRQRGASISEFSNWLNSNPPMLRAWQFIQQQQQQQQQQQMFAQQQQQQQQQPQIVSPVPQSVGLHPNSIPSQSSSCYPSIPNPPTVQHPCNPGRPMPQRHTSHPQPQPQSQPIPQMMSGPIPNHPSQQWAPVPQQARFRPPSHSSIPVNQPQTQQPNPQQQTSYYHQQSGKLGSVNSIPCQSQLNSSPRYLNHMGPQHQVQQQQQLQAGQMPMSSIMRGPGPMGVQNPQLIPRGGGNASMASGPSLSGMSVNPNRSGHPAPHYSSVMLSQLLGPGQTNSMSPSSMPGNDFMLSAVQQPVGRLDFSTPHPNVMPVNPHYQDTGNM